MALDAGFTPAHPPGAPVPGLSKRRYHAAGQVERELAVWLFAQGWVRRQETDRIVWVTDDGRRALKEWFGLSWPSIANQGGQLPVGEREG